MSLYKFPEPDEIQINESDLKLKFREFREALGNSPSLVDLFVIVPAWVPVFFSTFNNFHGFSGTGLKYAYTTLIGLATLTWLSKNRLLVSLFKKWVLRNPRWAEQVIDPDKKVDSIKKECEDEAPLQKMPKWVSRETRR